MKDQNVNEKAASKRPGADYGVNGTDNGIKPFIPPQLSTTPFDVHNVAQTLVGHLNETFQASPEQLKVVDIKVALEPIITYRVEMTVTPKVNK